MVVSLWGGGYMHLWGHIREPCKISTSGLNKGKTNSSQFKKIVKETLLSDSVLLIEEFGEEEKKRGEQWKRRYWEKPSAQQRRRRLEKIKNKEKQPLLCGSGSSISKIWSAIIVTDKNKRNNLDARKPLPSSKQMVKKVQMAPVFPLFSLSVILQAFFWLLLWLWATSVSFNKLQL